MACILDILSQFILTIRLEQQWRVLRHVLKLQIYLCFHGEYQKFALLSVNLIMIIFKTWMGCTGVGYWDSTITSCSWVTRQLGDDQEFVCHSDHCILAVRVPQVDVV